MSLPPLPQHDQDDVTAWNTAIDNLGDAHKKTHDDKQDYDNALSAFDDKNISDPTQRLVYLLVYLFSNMNSSATEDSVLDDQNGEWGQHMNVNSSGGQVLNDAGNYLAAQTTDVNDVHHFVSLIDKSLDELNDPNNPLMLDPGQLANVKEQYVNLRQLIFDPSDTSGYNPIDPKTDSTSPAIIDTRGPSATDAKVTFQNFGALAAGNESKDPKQQLPAANGMKAFQNALSTASTNSDTISKAVNAEMTHGGNISKSFIGFLDASFHSFSDVNKAVISHFGT